MKTICIKPHHFMDIIKLYGAGIEEFVPDEKMGHDFYKIANEIIKEPYVCLKLTTDGDDICQPCKKFNDKCVDSLNHIVGYTSKNEYNKVLDSRIISLLNLVKEKYTSLELCLIFYKSHEIIYTVWKEEANETTEKRHKLFLEGAGKYLEKYKA